MRRFIRALIAKITRRPLALSHEEDADGIIAAALYVRRYPNAVVILARPQEIRRDNKLNWFNWFTWDYVADLPCPLKALLRVDHHKTNAPCAIKEFYDPEAPSAAILAIKALGLESDEEALKLVKLSVETDTANISSEEAWLINDAVKGADYNAKVRLVYLLARYGLKALNLKEVKEWARRNKERRERGLKLLENLPLFPFMVLKFKVDLDYSYRGLCIELERRGAEVTCLIVPKSGRYRVYLGSRRNSRYDVSSIAVKLGGGGHKYAAGALIRDLSALYDELKSLTGCRKLKVLIIGEDGLEGVEEV